MWKNAIVIKIYNTFLSGQLSKSENFIDSAAQNKKDSIMPINLTNLKKLTDQEKILKEELVKAILNSNRHNLLSIDVEKYVAILYSFIIYFEDYYFERSKDQFKFNLEKLMDIINNVINKEEVNISKFGIAEN